MKARYFCENCKAEVRAGSSSCPSCGRVFIAVRCPECGYEGRAAEFKSGCPSCGFLEPRETVTAALAARKPRRRHALPPGFYRIAVIVLMVLLVALLLLLLFRT
jgi:hypothetical protein